MHVMGDVGDMNAHLPVAVGELAYREGIVEVFRVARIDGERSHATEILTLGNFLGSDSGVNLSGGLLHILGIFIG